MAADLFYCSSQSPRPGNRPCKKHQAAGSWPATRCSSFRSSARTRLIECVRVDRRVGFAARVCRPTLHAPDYIGSRLESQCPLISGASVKRVPFKSGRCRMRIRGCRFTCVSRSVTWETRVRHRRYEIPARFFDWPGELRRAVRLGLRFSRHSPALRSPPQSPASLSHRPSSA